MKTQSIVDRSLTLLEGKADKEQSLRFARLGFSVGPACVRITVALEQNTRNEAQIPICLFDTRGEIRIMKASEGSVGAINRSYYVAVDSASSGGIPGELPAGTWKLVLYKRRFFEDIAMRIRITTTFADLTEPRDVEALQRRCSEGEGLRTQPFSAQREPSSTLVAGGTWYCGELHVHSSESTGRTPVDEVLRVAHEQQLDFVAVTDHFTASHWLKLQGLGHSGRPLLLQSMEVSGDYGHANIHGINRWVNPLVDDNQELADFLELPQRPSMETIADEVHAQGGLFCINHAQSGMVAWRYPGFPLRKADLFEIWCLPDSSTTLLYPTMWDNLLCQGYHITGVGSSDSHHPSGSDVWRLGQIRTWVLANELSQPALLDGLKAGRAYVSYGSAKLQLSVVAQGIVYAMGDTVEFGSDGCCELRVELRDHSSGNLFVFINGFIHDIRYLKGGQNETSMFVLRWEDIPSTQTGSAYVRIEFHEDVEKSRFWGMAHRDHRTMRILSNPIWFDCEKETCDAN
jgi:hypothetical protein